MTIAAVQNNHAASGGAASVVVHLLTNTTATNFLAAAVCLPASASVTSVVDSNSNRWIQTAYSYTSGGNAELWTARGIQGGNASVTVSFSVAASVGVNVSEWSGVYGASPLDQWAQNQGTSASPTGQTLTPRATGDLFFDVCATGASISGPFSGYTGLTVDYTGHGAAYSIAAGSSTSSTRWNASGASVWATAAACFRAGTAVVNPLLQFPETMVQISTTTNYLAPLSGTGVWTDITDYVRVMALGPIGRQHLQDRVQAAPSQITCNNRDGTFNPWNTSSFLYNGGVGLKPMNPVKVTAAWNGITYPKYYGYFQNVLPQISDVTNVDATISCVDIFQLFALKYLSNNIYAQLITADGGTNLAAYYRLGDAPGQYSVANSASVAHPGSLLTGQVGSPAFGATGALLSDADTALDLTNGKNSPGGGFITNDNATSPPTAYNPLGAVAQLVTAEMWVKFTGGTTWTPSTSASVANQTIFAGLLSTGHTVSIRAGVVPVGTDLSGSGQVTNTYLGVVDGLTQFYEPTVDLLDGNWHLLVMTIKGDTAPGNVSWFIDNVPGAGSYASNNVSSSAMTNITVGASVNAINGFAGIVDEVALYTTILTQAQINNHYAYGQWFRSIEVGASVGTAAAGRLNKVMAVAGLPMSALVVPYPFLTQLYGETTPVTTTSALNYIQTQTETEPGIIFQGPNGLIYAYSREYQYLNPTSVTSQGIFGDNTSAAYHYDGTLLQIVQDDLDIFNDVQVSSARPGAVLQEWGPVQATIAATSASVYGPRTLQGLTSLQFELDSDALAVAQNYLAWYVNPLARVQQIVLHAHANGGNNIPQMLGRGLMDRITVQYTGQSPGPQFSQDSLVESIADMVDMGEGSWTTGFSLSPFEILLSPFFLDVSTLDGPAVLTL